MNLEERVKHSREDECSGPADGRVTPLRRNTQRFAFEAPESRSDYSVYTLRPWLSGSKEVVAVLIETKTSQHPKFIHGRAQVCTPF